MMALNSLPEFKNLNPKPSAAELFGTWGEQTQKSSTMQSIIISSIWAKWFWNRRFFHFASSNLGPSFKQFGKELLGNAAYRISSI